MFQRIQPSILLYIFITSLLFTACNDKSQNNSVMENKHRTHQESTYTCPMHPDVKGTKGDKCPKCGMDLVVPSQENLAKVEVKLTTEPQSIGAGIPTELVFAFQENNNNTPLDISHEMKVHLLIVDENLTWFRHIHPKEMADGYYSITETFPFSGKFFLFSDFKPQGMASIVDKKEITVKGVSRNQNADFSTKLVSEVDGYTLTLENGNEFKTNSTQSLKFTVEKDGEKLSESDIEPYLGATAHIAMIGKEDKDFLHIHPISDKHFPIYAEAHIKKPGIYRIWVEFQTNGKVHTADFTVNVQQGNEEHPEGSEHHHH